MSGDRKLDGRRAKALEAELIRRAEAVLSGDGSRRPIGPVAHALFGVAARIGEEVIRRLDQAPLKQADNFYTAAGIGRDPARPATLPVAVKLVDSENKAASAPPQLQLMAATDKGPVFFETVTGFDLAPGRIAALRGIDVAADAITIPSSSVMAAALPAAAPLKRRLRSGAAAGATKLQVDPAAGLAPGMLLRIGDGDAAHHYEATAVEGDLVTIEPALEAGLPPDAPVLEVGDFAPFETVTRNHQSHALYLGHASLLDVPSAVTITISGTALPTDAKWSWWGQLNEEDPPAWQELDGGGFSFTKLPGKLTKKNIRGHESLWLRARLPEKSSASASGRDIRITIGGGGPCGDRSKRCTDHLDQMNVGFEAIANTTPVVTNGPFHPFGREPRLYDSFYIGSDEAFSKAGADVSLCFGFAGADLGPMAAIKETDTTRIFGVGVDGLLYRAQMPMLVGGALQNAELQPVPSPSTGNRTAFLQQRSPVALWKTAGVKYVAVASAGGGAVCVAELDSGNDLSKTKWRRLPLPITGEVVALAVHGGSTTPILYALVGGSLCTWTGIAGMADGAAPGSQQTAVRDLMQVEPSDPLTGADAVLFVEATTGAVKLRRMGGGAASSTTFPPGDLPEAALQAFADPADPTQLFIAGYDAVGDQWELKLAEIGASGGVLTSLGKALTGLPPGEKLPVAFSRGRALTLGGPVPPLRTRPVLSIATTHPAHITWYQSAPNSVQPILSHEPTSIGASVNPDRRIVGSADYVVVQRPDVGLFFRPSRAAGAIVEDIRIVPGKGILIEETWTATATKRFVDFDVTGAAIPFNILGSPTGSNQTILAPNPPGGPLPPFGTDNIVAYDFDLQTGALTSSGSNVNLAGTMGSALTDIVALVKKTAPTPVMEEIWHLQRANDLSNAWPDPNIVSGTTRTYQILKEIDRVPGSVDVVLFPSSSLLAAAFTPASVVWGANNSDFQAVDLLDYGSGSAARYPRANILGNEAHFLVAASSWQSVGPASVPNPALSWEYWNGQSWWALATVGTALDGLVDNTANFLKDGGVFFKVPNNMQPTEVGGRKSHWLRARLVGGDYGEAKVSVTTPPGTSDQVVTRDLSTIRAPYVISLKLGYCAQQAVAPEIVLTEDSLGAIDQTSANAAGLEFPIFTPVGELMNPVSSAEKTVEARAEADRCDVPCPPPSPAPGSDCEAPGAYDSCDSPCIAPPGQKRTAAGEAPGFLRGLLLGFERGFMGNTISLHVDAEPTGPPNELVAEMLRDGRFVPIRVAGDTSYGLTEPGIVTLAIPAEPDRSELFGATAHWLRLRPKREAAKWSPRVRAIHLNAVLARSVETRVMERLGTSTGLEAQTFRLSEAPVDPGSLVLRVRETLAEEDDPNGELDVATYPSGLSGKWVRWEVSEDLIEGDEPERAFILDAEQGIIRFGDGTAGRIPPLGGDILAETYAKVIGNRANGVAPGSKLQLLTSLAGVERITAVDYAAGGSDAESPESARRRAPAKVRHGRRILTRADLEDHALTLSPEIAQVSAENRGGGMRLVVVLGGAEPKPSPAVLRGFADAIREVSGYGLARPGGLDVVGPRLLPIAIELVLQPRAPDLFAEAAEQAKARLVALFDPAIGNHDGSGWPLGRLPAVQDIAAALTPLEALALPVEATLRRADKEAAVERGLPETIPSDVLVRLDPDAIVFERSQEAAA